MESQGTVRNMRNKAYVSLLGTTQLHKRNPYIIAAWSLAFPGFGHLLLSKYLRGYALIIWEVFINQLIHLNEAMVYSFNGQFQAAKDILEPRFTMLYIPVYLFAIWDSYRSTVDMNKIYLLAQRENGFYDVFRIGAIEVNYLDKRKPWIAVVWSLGIPSLGQLYLHRIVLAGFIFVCSIILVWKSNLILAIHYLILGNIRFSTLVLEKQWLLYLPSFYFFSIYDAYMNTVENNKLFEDALKNHLLRKYQPSGTQITVGGMVE
ncbi:hypothetical protein [Brevibacillus choshinensis]|uniref:HTTM domain-containing protein n=1 Tax=Brevibacillus choshinensis TaxID=54911 RepID=A0ABX7FJY9_BRECH|nr:hypothetical protein [Brevibacillus choshinensis]QRG66098.1 hypothetical protein JNE38_21335 [Brevibacillus choshinensis]